MTKEHATHNPFDTLMRSITGLPVPTRNDCGYPGRYDREDNARVFGWGIEGEGLCDYPVGCPVWDAGKCPMKGGKESGK